MGEEGRKMKAGLNNGVPDHQLPPTVRSEAEDAPANQIDGERPGESKETASSVAVMEPPAKKARRMQVPFFNRRKGPTAALDSLLLTYTDPEDLGSDDDDDDREYSINPILAYDIEDEYLTGPRTCKEQQRKFYLLNDTADDVMCYVDKGTTALGFIYKGGVMVAVDHSSFASEGLPEKVIELSTHLLVTVSGGIKDCKTFLRDLQAQYRLYAKGRTISVAGASNWVLDYLKSLGEEGSSAEILIAGWDDTVPNLYYVDVKRGPLKGTESGIGSGSFHAKCALFEKNYRDMSADEAEKLADEVMQKATSALGINIRDNEGGEIGGFISAYRVQADGWQMVFRNKSPGEPKDRPGHRRIIM
ncbi:OLC1v1037978C1 [Oldenlandia corymbosa var. corymbosa]|uniref:OLC1v1037978C1 n=1 Tax=Oldenlandia corymbosa var. corymbosa TaxID=529605 RepID=A0AAV1D1W3_OLDCO|nr:OLC1v1037978C1 [Oldenlandia corymbosa var. corymbosa]